MNSRARGLVRVDEDCEGRATYLLTIITSLGGGGHQHRERARILAVRGGSEGGVGVQRHAGTREGFRARLVGFLPVNARFAALLQISIAF
jgi:hypothetical protein